jgi:uncharacterized beta-barrel protein YwiB (DUF1934 family)
MDKKYPVIGDVKITTFYKPTIITAEASCSLYEIQGADCGQSDLDCQYVKYAKLAEKSLQDGTCASQGYTVKGKVETKTYPVVGNITISHYSKPAIALKASCSLYEIQGADCGQSDLDCQYVKYAKLAEKALQDGTCASQGYTVKGKVETKTYPVVGNITISHYSKPAIALKASCSLYEIQGADCGQSDLDCQYVKYAKLAEKALQDGTCASQGYTVKGTSETRTYPVVGNITITHYSKPAIALKASCSLYEITGADCGQSDLDCQYVKYAKLAEKALQDGTCASQGYTVKGKVETKTYPVVGNITISHYSKPALEAATILL